MNNYWMPYRSQIHQSASSYLFLSLCLYCPSHPIPILHFYLLLVIILTVVSVGPIKFMEVSRMVGIVGCCWTSPSVSIALDPLVEQDLLAVGMFLFLSLSVHCLQCSLQQQSWISTVHGVSSWWRRLICLPSLLQHSVSSSRWCSFLQKFLEFYMHSIGGFLPGSHLIFEFFFLCSRSLCRVF